MFFPLEASSFSRCFLLSSVLTTDITGTSYAVVCITLVGGITQFQYNSGMPLRVICNRKPATEDNV